MQFFKRSLTTRLVVSFLLLSAFTVSAAGGIAYALALKALKNNIYARLEEASQHKVDGITQWIGEQRSQVVFISRMDAVNDQARVLNRAAPGSAEYRKAEQGLRNLFAAANSSNPSFSEVFLLSDIGGKVLLSSNPTNEGTYRINDTYYVMGRKRTYVQPIYPSPVTLQPTMTIATPLSDAMTTPQSEARGQIRGVIAVHLNLRIMDNLVWSHSGLGNTGRAYLVERSNILLDFAPTVSNAYRRGVHSPAIDAATRGQSGKGVYVNHLQREVIGSYRWIEEAGVALITEMDTGEALGPARDLAWAILLAGLFLVGLMAVGFMMMSRRIAGPILAIKESALQVAAGNWDAQAPVVSEDEVGTLARAFNQMVLQLNRYQEILSASEAYFRALIENGYDITLVINLNGKTQYCSPAVKRVLGYDPEEMLERSPLELVHPEDRERLVHSMTHPTEGNRFIEFRMQHADGSWRALEGAGNAFEAGGVVGYVINSRDITIRKQALSALAVSEEKFSKAFHYAADIVCVVRMEDQHIIEVSDAFFNLLGYQPEEVLNHSSEEFHLWVDPEQRQAIYEQLGRYEAIRNVEALWRTKSGMVLTGVVSAELVDIGDEPCQIIAWHDITEQKQAQDALQQANDELEMKVQLRTEDLLAMNQELQAMNEELMNTLETLRNTQMQLVQSEKMAALGNLVAGVAHEINTPVGIAVTAITNLEKLSGTFQDRYSTKNATRQELESFLRDCETAVSIIKPNLERSSRLIQSFKQVSVDQSNETKRVFRMREYLDEILTSLHPLLRKTRISVKVESDEITIDSYPGDYAQIITNLITNSLTHAFDLGAEGMINIEVRQYGQRIRIIYADNGRGMVPEVMNRIFEPFFTTRRGTGGTGLGMHIVYNLVTLRLGGSIDCESLPGQGAKFIIWLPIEEELVSV
ncbi:MAG: PAS domain S-box protein [Solirubrobacterales bacterium]